MSGAITGQQGIVWETPSVGIFQVNTEGNTSIIGGGNVIIGGIPVEIGGVEIEIGD